MQVYPTAEEKSNNNIIPPWIITEDCNNSKCGWPDEGAVPSTGAHDAHSAHRHSTVSKRARLSFGRRLLSRLRVEKIEGGLMVAGVLVAANCRVALPVFGFLFLLAGAVLTAAAYRGQESDEEATTYVERVEMTENSRVLGPACLVVGGLMLLAGVFLCTLTRRAQRQERQRRVGFHCPIHGDFYPANLKDSDLIADDDEESTWSCWRHRSREDDEEALGPRLRADSVINPQQAPLCPHSSHTSARSSLCSPWTNNQPTSKEVVVTASPCPTPQPFLVPSGSISGLVPTARLSPDQTFGSIRSLSITREVASFPMSRTPSPPPPRAALERCIMAEIASPTTVPAIPPPRPPPPTIRMVAPASESSVG
ncbi:uncharacterized protein LOC132205119 isoform X2 [Neocloeon triangulifer]|uniref:uncharacterized protein LOC132205119 isoform X2 n=1 Tax=Neocloeon triangulifer TaxID=2078957 RepID=UPI00286F81DC|nr:uncharacterized protein LOC132205119 isoform X2 [Neocloeon triangulifer]